MAFPTEEDKIQEMHEQAWIGDAVLALWARSWILEHDGHRDGEKMVRMTSNRFLSSFGNPTQVEANIAEVYQAQGLKAAFEYCEQTFVERFFAEEKNRANSLRQKQQSRKLK